MRREFITARAGYAKNGESRSIDMSETLLKSLQAIRINTEDNGVAFCNRNGTPYRSFRTAFTTAVRRAGIDDFTFHDLRHTFASRLVMARADLPIVQELMGHKDIKMTLRYAHLSSDHQRCAVGMMDQFGEKVATISVTDDESRHRNISQPIDIKHCPLSSAG